MPRRAVEAVGVAGSNEGEAHGLGGDEGAVVADDGAGRDGANAETTDFQLRTGAGRQARLGERRRAGGSKGGSNAGSEAVEGKAGAHQGLHGVARGQAAMAEACPASERGGIADVEPLGVADPRQRPGCRT